MGDTHVPVTKENVHKPGEHGVVKAHQKSHFFASFNIVENMKKINVSMSMWETLAIPGQTDILQRALLDEANPTKMMDEPVKAVLTNADENKEDSEKIVKESNKVIKPPPFYLSLIIGNKLVHNCMVDSGATSSVMPKKIAD